MRPDFLILNPPQWSNIDNDTKSWNDHEYCWSIEYKLGSCHYERPFFQKKRN